MADGAKSLTKGLRFTDQGLRLRRSRLDSAATVDRIAAQNR